MHKGWCSTEEVPYCFLMFSIKFQVHTGRKIDYLNPMLSKITRPVAAVKGVGGAVRFFVVGTIGKEERLPRGQLWMEQYLISLKYWPI